MLKERVADSPVIFELPLTAKIQVISQTNEGWSEIRYKNKKGWIESRYLSVQPNNAVTLENLKNEFKLFKRDTLTLESELEYHRKQQEKSVKELKELQRESYILLHKANHFKQLAEKPLSVEKKNKAIRQQVEVLKIENDLLRHTEELKQKGKERNWIALLVFFSILCAIIGIFIGSYISTRPKPFNQK